MADELPLIVTEDIARATKDDLVRRVAEQQQKLGMLPNIEAAEAFAEPIVRETIAREEERRAQAAIAPPVVAPAKVAPIRTREEFGDEPISRVLGMVTFGPDGEVTSDIVWPKRTPIRRGEQELLVERLLHLKRFPDWRDKVINAFLRPARRGHAIDCPCMQCYSDKADYVLDVLEQSNRIFGDWRERKV